MTDMPGLISREFFHEDGAQYVREEWDLTVSGCPMIGFDHTKWGTEGSMFDLDVVRLTRTIRLK